MWADQRNRQGGYLVIPQRTGWITSYPPVIIGYIMQMKKYVDLQFGNDSKTASSIDCISEFLIDSDNLVSL